jgi:hypothetical protein
MQSREALKADLTTAWQEGASHEKLLELLRRFGPVFDETQAAYDLLHEIWLEAGYDDSDEESALRNELEIALERAWFACPVR